MQTTRNIEKTTRTAREMAEVQRDSYEALAENFAAAQQRTIGLAQGGFKFMRLQEENARATQEFFANSVRLAAASAAQRRVRAGLDGRGGGGTARADRAQRATAETFARGV